jgi:hypothetical protein
MSDKNTCESCRFNGGFSCRRNPPTVVTLPNEYGPGEHAETAWPEVNREDWCGQWEGEQMSEEDVILAARKAPRAIG